MPTDSGTNDILSSGFMHYTTVVSLEMSDEPYFRGILPAIFKMILYRPSVHSYDVFVALMEQLVHEGMKHLCVRIFFITVLQFTFHVLDAGFWICITSEFPVRCITVTLYYSLIATEFLNNHIFRPGTVVINQIEHPLFIPTITHRYPFLTPFLFLFFSGISIL